MGIACAQVDQLIWSFRRTGLRHRCSHPQTGDGPQTKARNFRSFHRDRSKRRACIACRMADAGTHWIPHRLEIYLFILQL